MVAKTDRTVVRNAAYKGSEFNIRKRLSERKNQNYCVFLRRQWFLLKSRVAMA